MPDWEGDNPHALLIHKVGQEGVLVDLDEKGWATKHAELMRGAATWYLVHKHDGMIPIGIRVSDGEQPYYTARHIGVASGVPDKDGFMPASEVIAYGLGKKRLDGHVDRLWHFCNGLVVGGDDAESFGIEIVKRGLA